MRAKKTEHTITNESKLVISSTAEKRTTITTASKLVICSTADALILYTESIRLASTRTNCTPQICHVRVHSSSRLPLFRESRTARIQDAACQSCTQCIQHQLPLSNMSSLPAKGSLPALFEHPVHRQYVIFSK